MKQYLFLTSALVVSGLLSGVAEAACIQTPSCSSLGYTSSQSCNGGIKCPFGNAWNCTASDLSTQITELTNKITEQTNKITEHRRVIVLSGLSCIRIRAVMLMLLLPKHQSVWCLIRLTIWR